MKARLLIFLLGWLLARGAEGTAPVLRFEGRLTADATKAFTGTGTFRFELAATGEDGPPLWRSGEVRLAVQAGLYAAALGRTADGMPPLGPAVLARYPHVTLRAWFSVDGKKFEHLTPDRDFGALARAQLRRAEPKSAELARLFAQTFRVTPGRVVRLDAVPSAWRTEGAAEAVAVLVVVTEDGCAHCRAWDDAVRPRVMAEFVASGRLRLATAALPLAPELKPRLPMRGTPEFFVFAALADGSLIGERIEDEAWPALRRRLREFCGEGGP
jgi:hypothetical protein